jgi:hypothetical protein
MTEVRFDASEIEQLSRAIAKLPGQIKTKAMSSAMRRMREMARTRIVKRSAERTDLPVRKVQALTTAFFNAGGNTIEIVEKSGWIALYKLGAVQTSGGVRVKARGSYRHAFIAAVTAGSGGDNETQHTGVFMRVPGQKMRSNPKKEAIREMFGPNPAHDVTNNPDEFVKVLAELIEDHLAPRVLHELDRLLPR